MVKFMVVLCRKSGSNTVEFQRYFREVHAPLAYRMPGLKRHVVNFPADDGTRKAPLWDAIVELYFESREAMESAWTTPEGREATSDLELFADLVVSSWSLVDPIQWAPASG